MSLRTPLKLYHAAKKKIARTRGLCRLWTPGSLHVSCKISLQEVKRGSYGSEGPDECSKDTETVQEYVFFSMAEHDSSHCWWYSMDVVPGVNKGIGSTLRLLPPAPSNPLSSDSIYSMSVLLRGSAGALYVTVR